MEEEAKVRSERFEMRGAEAKAAAASGGGGGGQEPSLMAAYDEDQDQVF
jgi:hypothetical protein